jgi:DNA modification methylase
MPKEDFKLKGKRYSNVWQFKRVNPEYHPTQKPVAIIERIIESSTLKNDLVLDPFLGSGTTAVACKELGRNYIGIEISPE